MSKPFKPNQRTILFARSIAERNSAMQKLLAGLSPTFWKEVDRDMEMKLYDERLGNDISPTTSWQWDDLSASNW